MDHPNPYSPHNPYPLQTGAAFVSDTINRMLIRAQIISFSSPLEQREN